MAESQLLPEYINVPPESLGQGTPVSITVVKDNSALVGRMAEDMLDEIQSASRRGGAATMIVPVGPVDQYPVLADIINKQRINLREVMFIQMDEYLDEYDRPVPVDHSLSFTGFLRHKFYSLLDKELAPLPENQVAPDPADPDALQRLIDARCKEGGVDVCFGGIGINGHMAFNEPPEPGESMDVKDFASLPTRVLLLSRETITINANTVGGEISVIPKRVVTVGMKQILSARKLRFYCNRPWQSAVVRRVLHGPITAACPASLLRTHNCASLTITEQVAAVPDIRLR